MTDTIAPRRDVLAEKRKIRVVSVGRVHRAKRSGERTSEESISSFVRVSDVSQRG